MKESKLFYLNLYIQKSTLERHKEFSNKLDFENFFRLTQREESWRSLTEFEKRSQRRKFASIATKRLPAVGAKYIISVHSIYEQVASMLDIITTIGDALTEDNDDLFSIIEIYLLFLIEKDYINEIDFPVRHIPLDYFLNICKKYSNRFPEINLPLFCEEYEKMYMLFNEHGQIQ